jgi:hypothetical protein
LPATLLPADERLERIKAEIHDHNEQTKAEINARFERADAEIRRTFARLRQLDEQIRRAIGIRRSGPLQ